MSFKKAELCKACGIKNICHEPKKHYARSCAYFTGDIPEGFYFTEVGACKFVHSHWQGNKGYFVYPWGKRWVTYSQFELVIERGNERQASIQKQKRG